MSNLPSDPLLEPKKRGMTKLEREQALKEEVGKLNEELEATGQENEEQAAKWVIEVNKEQEKKDEEIQANQDEFFEEKEKKSFTTYIQALAKLTFNLLHYHVEWPENCTFYVGFDEKEGKVAVMVWTPEGKFARGFKPVKERKYDLNAVNVLIMQVENTIEKYFPKVENPIDQEAEPTIVTDKGTYAPPDQA